MDILRTHVAWQPRLRPSWIAASALTVLSAAVVAAVSLPPVPRPAATAALASSVTTSDVVAPAPLVLSFPTPVAAAPAAPPRPRATSAPRPAQAAPTPVGGRRPAASPDSRCSGDGWQQRRGAAALASLRRPADAQSFRIEFLPGRSGVLGLAYLQEQRIEIFVRSCAELSDGLLRHALAHEIGHLVDDSQMTTSRRTQWLSTRGIAPGTPWLGCNSCRDFRTPAGDFAEVYAQWQRGSTDNLSELAPAPAASALDRLAAQFF